ncbi:MAG: STAS domain-containing protein [Nitrospirota bacterium]|nr:STAS domain-containing protein [Nitrospirota bacterium]
MKILGKSKKGVLVAPEEMTILRAAELASDLLEVFGEPGGNPGRVVLKADDVAHVDTAALQILVSAGRSARERGGELVIQDPSPVFRETVEQLGLEKVLFGSR